jgi:hypothetical protein
MEGREPAVSALELYRRLAGRRALATGLEELDALIGGIEGGVGYLFYGDEDRLNELVHSLLVSAVAPREKGGWGARALYINNTDYYTAKTLLSPPLLGELAKRRGLEPLWLLDRISVLAAYNEERQRLVAEEARKAICGDPTIKLVLVHNMTCFLEKGKGAEEIMVRALGLLREACAFNASLVVTAGSKRGPRGVPVPLGGAFFRACAGRHRLPYKGEGDTAQASLAPGALLRSPGGQEGRHRPLG